MERKGRRENECVGYVGNSRTVVVYAHFEHRHAEKKRVMATGAKRGVTNWSRFGMEKGSQILKRRKNKDISFDETK